MVLHTKPTLRTKYITEIRAEHPEFSESQLNQLATDRLQYLHNKTINYDNDTKAEIGRVLGIKAVFNKSNDDIKYKFNDKNSIVTNFIKP
jgi:hypothetical protein